jgi:IS1 family transposase
MIGDSTLPVDDMSDISIKERHLKGARGLWELLTRKNVNRAVVTTDDLKRYDYLKLTNAYLQGYEPGGNVQTSRATNFREVISKFFSSDEAASRSRSFITATLGEVLTWLESCTLIPNAPAASRP